VARWVMTTFLSHRQADGAAQPFTVALTHYPYTCNDATLTSATACGPYDNEDTRRAKQAGVHQRA
jgi:hypothetical protein